MQKIFGLFVSAATFVKVSCRYTSTRQSQPDLEDTLYCDSGCSHLIQSAQKLQQPRNHSDHSVRQEPEDQPLFYLSLEA